MQKKQVEWSEQWTMFSDTELRLFTDWIYPNLLENFRGKDVLECGCGGGQHTSFVAPFAKSVAAVDLNTVEIARLRNRGFDNVTFIEDDIATMDLGRTFDIVFSIGVVHHTDDPDKTVANLKRHVRPGGRLILWVYAFEGNFMMRRIVEPARQLFFRTTGRKKLLALATALTAAMYVPVYTLYLLPLRFLPYYHYFGSFRMLPFRRNVLNVFDKLNAPQVFFIPERQVRSWFKPGEFESVHISFYSGVSWRGSGQKI